MSNSARNKTQTSAVTPDRIRAIAADQFSEEIDEQTAEVLSELMDDMVESLVDWSVKVAEAKGSSQLDPDDIRFVCEQEWGISLKEGQPLTSSLKK